MASKIALSFVAVMLCAACTKKEQVSPPPVTDRSPRAAPSGEPARRDASAGPVLVPKAAALPPLAPLATGKRLRIKKLDDDIEPLEITVPPKFKLHMEGGEELAASAHVVGPGLEIVIEQPEGEFFTLSEKRDLILRGDADATFIRAEETADGYLLIDRNKLGGDGPRYDSAVSRPKLKVKCGAYALEQLSDAERVASVCLTLRAVPGEVGN